MEMTDRPHRSTTNNNASASASAGGGATGELFICFTSRLSSSMKLPSKSILSPARNQRDSSQISLSTSLSRRLRPSGSLRAGQASPMFPPSSTTGKKRGCAFDNPEPTSPKVTCIGQVRVKTKGKKIRPRSKPMGEVSFRKIDPNNAANNLDMAHLHQSQQECRKWVHLPVTICEALRAIGTEFNCFLPCRSSCMANKQEKASSEAGSGGNGGGDGGGSCGAVLARWLVAAVQEGEAGGRGRQIELVVGEEEEEEEDIIRSSHRKHVFEDIEINLCENEKEQGRMSICIPPKNALLLMRCRSDPVKMAALANRSWEPAVGKGEHYLEEEDEVEEEKEDTPIKAAALGKQEEEPQIEQRKSIELSSCEKLLPSGAVEEQDVAERDVEPESITDREEAEEFLEGPEETSLDSKLEGNMLHETAHESPSEGAEDVEIETAQERKSNVSGSEQEKESNQIEQTAEPEPELEPDSESEPVTLTTPDFDDNLEEKTREQEFVEAENEQEASPVSEAKEETEEKDTGTEEGKGRPEPPDPEETESKQEEKLLPDCLLLMMCEPKLSMEVSKETWVCSRDFIRRQPEKQTAAVKVKRKDGPHDDESKRRISVDRRPPLLQPPRSSCSFPAAPPVAASGGCGGSMATMIEQKLVGAKGCEPFVLTRCKSEPMRSSAKLAPDSCFWKNRKLEPAAMGVGAAGVGV